MQETLLMTSLASVLVSRPPLRALLADSDPYFRPYAAAALRQSGFVVQELRDAASLPAALSNRGALDIIVIHAGMACADALEAVRCVRELAPDVPILMVAEPRATGALRDGLALGANRVLPRPGKVVELAASARELVRTCSAERRAAAAAARKPATPPV
jgi:DNA-binding response OmpR family regulator